MIPIVLVSTSYSGPLSWNTSGRWAPTLPVCLIPWLVRLTLLSSCLPTGPQRPHCSTGRSASPSSPPPPMPLLSDRSIQHPSVTPASDTLLHPCCKILYIYIYIYNTKFPKMREKRHKKGKKWQRKRQLLYVGRGAWAHNPTIACPYQTPFLTKFC
jgi:hypothetical protein